jgi:hypothetical protein
LDQGGFAKKSQAEHESESLEHLATAIAGMSERELLDRASLVFSPGEDGGDWRPSKDPIASAKTTPTLYQLYENTCALVPAFVAAAESDPRKALAVASNLRDPDGGALKTRYLELLRSQGGGAERTTVDVLWADRLEAWTAKWPAGAAKAAIQRILKGEIVDAGERSSAIERLQRELDAKGIREPAKMLIEHLEALPRGERIAGDYFDQALTHVDPKSRPIRDFDVLTDDPKTWAPIIQRHLDQGLAYPFVYYDWVPEGGSIERSVFLVRKRNPDGSYEVSEGDKHARMTLEEMADPSAVEKKLGIHIAHEYWPGQPDLGRALPTIRSELDDGGIVALEVGHRGHYGSHFVYLADVDLDAKPPRYFAVDGSLSRFFYGWVSESDLLTGKWLEKRYDMSLVSAFYYDERGHR